MKYSEIVKSVIDRFNDIYLVALELERRVSENVFKYENYYIGIDIKENPREKIPEIISFDINVLSKSSYFDGRYDNISVTNLATCKAVFTKIRTRVFRIELQDNITFNSKLLDDAGLRAFIDYLHRLEGEFIIPLTLKRKEKVTK